MDESPYKDTAMTSKDGSTNDQPRFDAVLTAAEKRRDDWQWLLAVAQACRGAADAGDAATQAKLSNEAQTLLTSLERLESFWAFPGLAMLHRLREKLTSGDSTGFAEMARRLARALLGGTYRHD